MKSLVTLGLLLALAVSAPGIGSQLPVAAHTPSSAVSAAMLARASGSAPLAVAPRTTPDAVEPAERVSEPEGAFGFARILLGLLVAAMVGAAIWIGSRYARRRRGGGRHRDP